MPREKYMYIALLRSMVGLGDLPSARYHVNTKCNLCDKYFDSIRIMKKHKTEEHSY